MQIKQITIQKFRGIEELKDFELKNLSLLVGENGTSKTSILEAVNFCLSPYFLSGRIKHTDFYKSEVVEIVDYDIFLIKCLSDGYSQEQISDILKEKEWLPTSISSIEKKLKFLREHFNANNPTHLVSIAKDLGLI